MLESLFFFYPFSFLPVLSRCVSGLQNFRIGGVGTAEIEIARGGTKKTVVTLNGTRAEARHDSPRP